VAAGTCIVDANQAGDAEYAPAIEAQQHIAVSKASQTISFTSTPPSLVSSRTATYAPSASSSSGLPVSIALDSHSTGCRLAGGVVRFAGVGVCRIDAIQSGDARYTSARRVQQAISVHIVSTAPPTTTTTHHPRHGYWLVGGDGGIFTFGSAQFFGSTGSLRLQRPVVGITPTRRDAGYWLDASDGGIFSFGNAGFYGSIPGLGILPAGTPGDPRRLNAPVVGMVPSADGAGYFMVASDGGVFAFGDAKFEGSCPALGGCSGAAVAVMPDSSGNGYWLVTATGHVYTFGDAVNYGPGLSAGTVTSAIRSPDGKGFWLLLANGLVHTYGDAVLYGSLPPGIASGLNPATSIFTTADGRGYWIATANGGVYSYGDATSDGSMAGKHLNAPIIAAVGW
jgi:hypothetical protein